jgi:hypothetical protein
MKLISRFNIRYKTINNHPLGPPPSHGGGYACLLQAGGRLSKITVKQPPLINLQHTIIISSYADLHQFSPLTFPRYILSICSWSIPLLSRRAIWLIIYQEVILKIVIDYKGSFLVIELIYELTLNPSLGKRGTSFLVF